jgi:GH15 family glucan-1,4-alpha-glucosidase
MSTRPIADHALLSDRHSAALVTNDGSIDWLCFPRFDSPSVFAAILDDDAGHWSIRPAGPARVEREYVEGSMVLRTTFHTDEGVLELLDAMALGDLPDPHRLGEHAPHTLLRAARCTSGQVEVEMCFRPRLEYGLIVPLLTATAGGILATGGPDRLTLSTPVPLSHSDGEARARFTLDAGQHRYFAVRRTALGHSMPPPCTQGEIAAALETTIAGWRTWSALHQSYDGPWRELVHHSGRVLQALSYRPTGAIVAAPTTSLPEQSGGERNWDYRYSWVRDASFTMQALWVAACPDEAHEFFDFMTAAAAHSQAERPCRSCSASAASTTCPNASCPICAAGATAAPSGSATARGPNPSSTSTANSSTPPSGCASNSANSPPPPGRSSPASPTPPPTSGSSRTTASGRSAAGRGTSSTPS